MRLLFFFFLLLSIIILPTQVFCYSTQQLRALCSCVIGTEFHRTFFGSQEADGHIQAMAQEIMYTMDIDPETIKVMDLNNAGFELWGICNCIATANTIFIDEAWFELLAEDEQRFLLAHEIAHIKNHDNQITVGATTLLCALSSYITYKVFRADVSIASLAAFIVGSILFVPAWIRMQELRADLDGAQAIGSTAGGISLARAWLKYGRESHDMFATHPSNQKRIAALQRLEHTFD